MLNMDVLKLRDDLSNVKVLWPDYKVVQSIAGLLYSMRESFTARDPQKIINHFVEEFRKRAKQGVSNMWNYYGSLDELIKFVREILMECKEFRMQNLSDKEYESGCDVDDDSTRLADMGDHNWIDLDAFLQNVWYNLSLEFFFDTLCEKCTKFDVTLS